MHLHVIAPDITRAPVCDCTCMSLSTCDSLFQQWWQQRTQIEQLACRERQVRNPLLNFWSPLTSEFPAYDRQSSPTRPQALFTLWVGRLQLTLSGNGKKKTQVQKLPLTPMIPWVKQLGSPSGGRDSNQRHYAYEYNVWRQELL